jgi:hypothetical protein
MAKKIPFSGRNMLPLDFFFPTYNAISSLIVSPIAEEWLIVKCCLFVGV